MKIIKEIKEQYAYLWWWLLTQGIVVSTILVNLFMLTVFGLAMTLFYFLMRYLGRH